MKTTKIGSTDYLAIGIAIFPLGLLMLLRQPTLLSLLSSIMPDTLTIEVFGLIIQFIGEGLICFGIIGAISGRVNTQTEYNRQILQAIVSKNLQDHTMILSGIKRSMDEQILQLHDKSNARQSQNAGSSIQRTEQHSCKFCGERIQQGSFCPQCGKAN